MTDTQLNNLDATAQPAVPRVLRAEELVVEYDGVRIIENLSLEIPRGRITAIIGANACGKSTLLSTLARLKKPAHGRVTLDGDDINSLPRKAFARMLGMLPQHPVAPEGVTVVDLVGRGRYPHRSLFSGWSAEDDRIVENALRQANITELADQALGELSGGQRQRAWIAMALAQDPDILLLDEPTTYLDLNHQLDVLDVLSKLNGARGTTIVMVLHELNFAARYADHLVIMSRGEIIAQGKPGDVISAETIMRGFQLDSRVIADPVTGTPLIIPNRRRPTRDERNPKNIVTPCPDGKKGTE